MTVALVNQECETRYVPGAYASAPATRFGWYGNFSGYYSYRYLPCYYNRDEVCFLEASI